MSLIILLKSLGQNPTNRQLKKLSKALSEITVLDLSNQNLNTIHLKNLFSALSLNVSTSDRRLTTLNLSGNAFGGDVLDKAVMLSLVRVIRDYPNLKHLNLANNHIGDEGIQILISGLSDGTTLDCLQLEDNDLSSKSFSNLFNIISNCETRIFPTTFFGPYFREIENKFSGPFTKNRESVKKKEIRDPVLALLREMGSNPTSAQRRALIEILSRITDLDLSFQKLTAKNIFNLAKALESNTSLKTLNLAGNKFGELDEFGDMTIKHTMAILSLSKMIRCNNCLTDLILTDNHINDEGLGFLAQGLKQNSTLDKFDLNRNALTDESFSVLSSIIACSTHRVFPLTFLSSWLFAQPTEVRSQYLDNVYTKNETCVIKNRERDQQREQQEEHAKEVQGAIKRCLSSAEDLLERARDGAIRVGQTPPITIVRETPGSKTVETKWTEQLITFKEKLVVKKLG